VAVEMFGIVGSVSVSGGSLSKLEAIAMEQDFSSVKAFSEGVAFSSWTADGGIWDSWWEIRRNSESYVAQLDPES